MKCSHQFASWLQHYEYGTVRYEFKPAVLSDVTPVIPLQRRHHVSRERLPAARSAIGQAGWECRMRKQPHRLCSGLTAQKVYDLASQVLVDDVRDQPPLI
eukprot:scaffold125983_cov51-Prasinocladus_malaysianus.AAC.1